MTGEEFHIKQEVITALDAGILKKNFIHPIISKSQDRLNIKEIFLSRKIMGVYERKAQTKQCLRNWKLKKEL